MAYSNAADISKWFLAKNKSAEADGADMISNLKLQKLLYYAQGCVLALFSEPLFDEDIVAWEHGPVVVSEYQKYKCFHANGIEVDDLRLSSPIDSKVESVLEDVYKEFGQYSAWKLRNMTHEETPWLSTNKNQTISQEIIKTYFIENYIEQ